MVVSVKYRVEYKIKMDFKREEKIISGKHKVTKKFKLLNINNNH